MVLHHLVGWLRSESRSHQGGSRWARWIGRSWARLSYALRVEPTWLELNRHDVPVTGLPAALAGLQIVQLSDFHCSRQVTPAYLEEAVDLALDQQGDVVVLTGDFVHKGHRYVDRIASILGRLESPQGVFAVLGNHDYSVRNSLGFRRYRHLHRAVAEALTARGIRVLHNETVRLQRGGEGLHLIGVNDLWSRSCDLDRAFAGLSPSLPHVVLAHNPRTIERLGRRRCDLMLSGHTHGGQIHLPGVGRPALGRKAGRFAAGMYRYQSSYLYVNKGVGFGFRLRFGVRPEVAVFTLQAAPGTRESPAPP
jgi:predicted MPP superfamily phosphohydrolase